MERCDVCGNCYENRCACRVSDAGGDANAAPNRLWLLVRDQEGAAGWALLWLLGIPIPVLLVLFLLRGCT